MTVTERYSDEPRCRACLHPKVVHKGQAHVGECAAMRWDDDYADRCTCVAFKPIDSARLPAAPDKGEQPENLNNQTQRSGDMADA